MFLLPSLEVNADSLNLYNTILSGIIITIVTIAIERIVNYVKRKHDVILKNSYSINSLTEEITTVKTELADTIRKLNENIMVTKETVSKMDSMAKEVNETRRAYRKLLNVLYKHESEIKMIATKNNVDISAFEGSPIRVYSQGGKNINGSSNGKVDDDDDDEVDGGDDFDF